MEMKFNVDLLFGTHEKKFKDKLGEAARENF